MADIAAADTTAKILWRRILSPQTYEGQAGQPLIEVGVRITVDPGTTDAYPTGGILLSPLFTGDDASDTYLDVAQPIVCTTGMGILRAAAATLTPGIPCQFYNGGLTAATQTLVCYLGDANASDAALQEHPNSDITAATSLNGDTDAVVEMVLVGRLRPGIDVTAL